MTVMSSTSFKVVQDAGRRRVVTSASRPDLRLPEAHPARPVAPRGVGQVASCSAAGLRRRPAGGVWVKVKVAVVGLLAVAGAAASVSSFVAMAQPDPAQGYVAGDPAWAHVTQP